MTNNIHVNGKIISNDHNSSDKNPKKNDELQILETISEEQDIIDNDIIFVNKFPAPFAIKTEQLEEGEIQD